MRRQLTRRRFLRATAAVATGTTILSRTARADEAEWGDLVGRFQYDGPPPARKRLTVDKDVDCCGQYDIRDESLMVGEDGGLANVYVYCRERRVDISPELAESVEPRVTLANEDCIFIPHCMKIWLDRQEFYTYNSQPIADNVAFTPLGDRPANIILPPGTEENPSDATWTFRRRQRVPVPVLCNYHPWESAYILPLDHPYCAISESDGTFRIPKLPVGRLEFQVWHERTGYLEAGDWRRGRFEVEITPGETDLGTVTLPPALFEA